MPAKSTCQPWCEEHKDDYDDSCNMMRCLYKHDKESAASTGSPELDALREQFQALTSLTASADTIFLEVTKSDEDEQPLASLTFWDSNTEDDSAVLETSIAGLRDLHKSLGQAIARLEQCK